VIDLNAAKPLKEPCLGMPEHEMVLRGFPPAIPGLGQRGGSVLDLLQIGEFVGSPGFSWRDLNKPK
jgi:hypothetical protein